MFPLYTADTYKIAMEEHKNSQAKHVSFYVFIYKDTLYTLYNCIPNIGNPGQMIFMENIH